MTQTTTTTLLERIRPVVIDHVCPALAQCGPNINATLNCIEANPVARARVARDQLQITFWNAERGYTPEYAAELLDQIDADVTLLCELDHGVGRTGQRHVSRDIAQQLKAGHLYAVEFVEMDARESGELGLHGNAIISHVEMSSPVLVRLSEDQHWTSGHRRARRRGGRIALGARVQLDDKPIVVVTTHLESHASPDTRALQMQALLDAIDDYADGDPVLIGGDFNTRTASKDDLRERAARQRLSRQCPELFTQPQTHEPLFNVAARAGYDWTSCNLAVPTERPRHPGDDTLRFRLDWFFARGLICKNPGIVIAESETGVALSDHDIITLSIRLP